MADSMLTLATIVVLTLISNLSICFLSMIPVKSQLDTTDLGDRWALQMFSLVAGTMLQRYYTLIIIYNY